MGCLPTQCTVEEVGPYRAYGAAMVSTNIVSNYKNSYHWLERAWLVKRRGFGVGFLCRVSMTKAQDLYRKADPTEPVARLTLSGSALLKQRVPSGAGAALRAFRSNIGIAVGLQDLSACHVTAVTSGGRRDRVVNRTRNLCCNAVGTPPL